MVTVASVCLLIQNDYCSAGLSEKVAGSLWYIIKSSWNEWQRMEIKFQQSTNEWIDAMEMVQLNLSLIGIGEE